MGPKPVSSRGDGADAASSLVHVAASRRKRFASFLDMEACSASSGTAERLAALSVAAVRRDGLRQKSFMVESGALGSSLEVDGPGGLESSESVTDAEAGDVLGRASRFRFNNMPLLGTSLVVDCFCGVFDGPA